MGANEKITRSELTLITLRPAAKRRLYILRDFAMKYSSWFEPSSAEAAALGGQVHRLCSAQGTRTGKEFALESVGERLPAVGWWSAERDIRDGGALSSSHGLLGGKAITAISLNTGRCMSHKYS